MAQERLPIANGPSKFDLMVSLFDGDSRERRVVTFFTQSVGMRSSVGVRCVINDVQREDGSGENWNFKGQLADGTNTQVRGYFSTKDRKGSLIIEN